MTHPDKIILLAEECENLQSASAHLQFSIERTRELIQRIREEISPELVMIAKQAADYSVSLIKRLQGVLE